MMLFISSGVGVCASAAGRAGLSPATSGAVGLAGAPPGVRVEAADAGDAPIGPAADASARPPLLSGACRFGVLLQRLGDSTPSAPPSPADDSDGTLSGDGGAAAAPVPSRTASRRAASLRPSSSAATPGLPLSAPSASSAPAFFSGSPPDGVARALPGGLSPGELFECFSCAAASFSALRLSAFFLASTSPNARSNTRRNCITVWITRVGSSSEYVSP
mmetsp:Transcript_23073/g.57968  ORF Transcript_23073/g.57968 Transcript_23073/m.57968 type:complete len:218 (+) Transcript_23073:1010-1663(+)